MTFKLKAAERLHSLKVEAAVTSKRIEQEIKKRFGYDVKLHKGQGYFYFDDPDDKPGRVSKWYSTSVYVNSLNQLTLEQWLHDFQGLMEDNEGKE